MACDFRSPTEDGGWAGWSIGNKCALPLPFPPHPVYVNCWYAVVLLTITGSTDRQLDARSMVADSCACRKSAKLLGRPLHPTRRRPWVDIRRYDMPATWLVLVPWLDLGQLVRNGATPADIAPNTMVTVHAPRRMTGYDGYSPFFDSPNKTHGWFVTLPGEGCSGTVS